MKFMEIILKAEVSKVNGCNQKTEIYDFAGMKFESQKEKDKFRKAKEREIFDSTPDKCEDLQIKVYLTTLIPPDGVTEVPADFKLQPMLEVKPVVRQPIYIEPKEPFKFRKPVFK